MEAAYLKLSGIVQGVGFRPFVFRLAQALQIKGWVCNTGDGVHIHAEGNNIAQFYQRLQIELPPLARVYSKNFTLVDPQGFRDFRIIESDAGCSKEALISPDLATCPNCLQEVSAKGNRRGQYPFTNCTNCGPRYSIILDLPYDRPNTTMAGFTMCLECMGEYLNPRDRRFHAQPIACPVCGPQAALQDEQGRLLRGLGVEQLKQGFILAVKGLGGFHLACSALDRRAVESLRRRKNRLSKPFAVMARNLDVVRNYCEVSELEEQLLTGVSAPIVVLRAKAPLPALGLPDALAPGLNTLGVMLPYTPLHHLILQEGPNLLVMTSANHSGDPMVFQNEDALRKLRGIADYWLTHNRDVYHPVDDSVLRVIYNQPVFLRRARGYVPLPQELDGVHPPLIALGGDLKNTFCLLQNNQAFISQHGGDLTNYESYKQFVQSLDSFRKLVSLEPYAVAYDLHPEYQSTHFAKTMGLPELTVQHHHAHLAACLAENQVRQKVLGVICDGTGFGLDGKIWGFEFLWGDRAGFERAGHLEYLPLAGGDFASRFPARVAAGYLAALFSPEELDWGVYLPDLSQSEIEVIKQQVARGFNLFETSSCGRLFDAVAALAGFRGRIDYEGQAAIELEDKAVEGEDGVYPFELELSQKELLLKVKKLFKALLADLDQEISQNRIAARFHNTLVSMIMAALERLGCKYSSKQVVLAGGVFQNKYLVEMLIPRLAAEGFTVYLSSLPGDGGLCLGQAVVASEVIANVSGDSRPGSGNWRTLG